MKQSWLLLACITTSLFANESPTGIGRKRKASTCFDLLRSEKRPVVTQSSAAKAFPVAAIPAAKRARPSLKLSGDQQAIVSQQEPDAAHMVAFMLVEGASEPMMVQLDSSSELAKSATPFPQFVVRDHPKRRSVSGIDLAHKLAVLKLADWRQDDSDEEGL